MDAARHDDGHWTVSGDAESEAFRKALTRELNALDPVFTRAREALFSLYRTRQTLADTRQRMGADAAMLGRVGEALASVRVSERV